MSARPGGGVLLLQRDVRALEQFPDQNPNPVLRVGHVGVLLYANRASAPIRRTLGTDVGERLPADLLARLESATHEDTAGAVLVEAEGRRYRLVPVVMRNQRLVNVYGTDVTELRILCGEEG